MKLNVLQDESNVAANKEIMKIMDNLFFLFKLEKNQFTVPSRLSGSCFGVMELCMTTHLPYGIGSNFYFYSFLQLCKSASM